MSDDRFPFGLSSHVALVTLVNRSNPKLQLNPDYVEFGDMYSSPTPDEPGRTYIEMLDKSTGHKAWYVYRRVNINKVVVCRQPIRVPTPLIPRQIVAELNRQRNLALSDIDVEYHDNPVPTENGLGLYKLEILPGSYVYYGWVDVPIYPIAVNPNYWREEDNTIMLQEDGTFMLLEEVA